MVSGSAIKRQLDSYKPAYRSRNHGLREHLLVVANHVRLQHIHQKIQRPLELVTKVACDRRLKSKLLPGNISAAIRLQHFHMANTDGLQNGCILTLLNSLLSKILAFRFTG